VAHLGDLGHGLCTIAPLSNAKTSPNERAQKDACCLVHARLLKELSDRIVLNEKAQINVNHDGASLMNRDEIATVLE
jgi:hypothetical protein